MKSFLTSCLLSAVAAAACSSPPDRVRTEPPQATVLIAHASTTAVPRQFEAGGVVRARLTAPIAARVLAPVSSVTVHPGDRVRKGQIVITLDGRDLHAQAEHASAGLVAAREAVRAATADAQGAVAALALVTQTFNRVKGLHEKRSATQQELDEATASLEAARARAASADAHVAESSAALTAAQSATDAAAIAASYATITAPFDGAITERLVDPGAIASPAAPLLTIEDVSAFRLEVRLDEARAQEIAVGQPANVRLDSVEDLNLPARVAEVSRVDPASHAFLAKLDLPSLPHLRSGLFGRAVFSGMPRTTLTAPAAALIRRGQLTFVFVVDRERLARLRPVTVGESFGDRVEIIAGLVNDDPIVANPPASLTDGTRVTDGARR